MRRTMSRPAASVAAATVGGHAKRAAALPRRPRHLLDEQPAAHHARATEARRRHTAVRIQQSWCLPDRLSGSECADLAGGRAAVPVPGGVLRKSTRALFQTVLGVAIVQLILCVLMTGGMLWVFSEWYESLDGQPRRALAVAMVHEHRRGAFTRRRDCHSAETPSPFSTCSRCVNTDGEGVSAK